LNDGPGICGAKYFESLEKGHGRIEARQCMALLAKDLPAQNEWEDLTTIVRVSRERKEQEKVHQETVYYITSLDQEVELIANSVRDYWKIDTCQA